MYYVLHIYTHSFESITVLPHTCTYYIRIALYKDLSWDNGPITPQTFPYFTNTFSFVCIID